MSNYSFKGSWYNAVVNNSGHKQRIRNFFNLSEAKLLQVMPQTVLRASFGPEDSISTIRLTLYFTLIIYFGFTEL